MHLFTIVSASTQPLQLALFRQWCLVQWSRVDTFDSVDIDIAVPGPILAIIDRKLIGGLAFTSHPKPGSKQSGLWINALIVAPDHRGKGVASALIKAAEAEAMRYAVPTLFVYTSVESLYRKLGWIELSPEDKNSILHKSIADTARTCPEK